MIQILADENFPMNRILLLKKAGFNVKAISIQNSGITDVEVMQIAISEKKRLLLLTAITVN